MKSAVWVDGPFPGLIKDWEIAIAHIHYMHLPEDLRDHIRNQSRKRDD